MQRLSLCDLSLQTRHNFQLLRFVRPPVISRNTWIFFTLFTAFYNGTLCTPLAQWIWPFSIFLGDSKSTFTLRTINSEKCVDENLPLGSGESYAYYESLMLPSCRTAKLANFVKKPTEKIQKPKTAKILRWLIITFPIHLSLPIARVLSSVRSANGASVSVSWATRINLSFSPSSARKNGAWSYDCVRPQKRRRTAENVQILSLSSLPSSYAIPSSFLSLRDCSSSLRAVWPFPFLSFARMFDGWYRSFDARSALWAANVGTRCWILLQWSLKSCRGGI